MRLLGEIFGVLAVGVFISVFWHERGWKLGSAKGYETGYQSGFKQGHVKGMQEGFEAGKTNADNFWLYADSDVLYEVRRQKMRKEGWP